MKKLFKIVCNISFVVYLFILFFLLFLGGRHAYVWNEVSLLEYIQFSSNFVPFQTISLYVNALIDGSLNIDIPLKNLFGNLLLFLPMGIYLPFYVKKQNRIGFFTPTMFAILLLIEVVQVVTRLGSFDIDDLILNIAGALFGFAIWQLVSKNETT